MSTPVVGLVVLCNPDGTLRRLLRDDIGLGEAFVPDRALTSILDVGSFHKGLNFLAALRAGQVRDEWELHILVRGTPRPMHVVGGATPDGLVVIATSSRQHLERVCAEIAETAEELTEVSRQCIQTGGWRTDPTRTSEEALYEDFTRVYNDFANLQREVTRQNAELKRLHRDMNCLLGMATHDLRNPLASVQLNTTCLLESARSRLDPDEIACLEEIEQASETMRRLIEDLLDVAKVEAGGPAISQTSTDLVAFIKATLQLNQLLATRKRIRVTYEAHYRCLMVDIDPPRIRQVLNNLLSNAIAYSMPDTTIRIGLECDTSTAIVSVIDEGQGIPPEELPRLFQPFSRTSVQPTAGEPSTGLGLAICKKLIRAHGGRIWAESVPGQGSIFRFTVPRSAA